MDTKQASSTATFTKFRGQWAARVPASVSIEVGDAITITKRSGEQVLGHVTEVLARFDDNHIVAFRDGGARRIAKPRALGGAGYRPTPRHGLCRECRKPLTAFDRQAAAAPGYHFDCA